MGRSEGRWELDHPCRRCSGAAWAPLGLHERAPRWTRLTGADAGAAVDAEYKSFQHYSLHPFTMSMLMQAAVAQDKATSFAPKIHSWLATRLPAAPAGTGVASAGVALLELAIKEGSAMRASLKALGGFTRPETEGMLFKWTQIRRGW